MREFIKNNKRLVFLSSLGFLIFIESILILIFLPPFQGLDEQYHFYRMFQLSELNNPTVRSGPHNGAELPRILMFEGGEFLIKGRDLSKFIIPTSGGRFGDLIWNFEKKLSFSQFFETLSASPKMTSEALSDRTFTITSAISSYSAVSYFHMFPAVWISKVLRLSVVECFYLTRLLNLLINCLFSVLIVWLLLKRHPGFASLLSVLYLMPMAAVLRTIVSADSFLISVTHTFVVLLLIFGQRIFKGLNQLFFLFLCAFVSFSKMLYLLVTLSVFSDVRELPLRSKIRFVCGYLLLVIAPWTTVALLLHPGYAPLWDEANVSQQIEFLKDAPLDFLWIVLKTLWHGLDQWLVKEFVGQLSWDTALTPFVALWSCLGLFCVSALDVEGEASLVSLGKRIFFGVIILLEVLAISISVYIYVSPAKSDFAWLIQGRYFIPLVPLVYLSIGKLIRVKRNFAIAVVSLASLINILIFIHSLKLIINRYWIA